MFLLIQLFGLSYEDIQEFLLLLEVVFSLYSFLKAIKPGISVSAKEISFLPKSANEISFYFKIFHGRFSNNYNLNNQLMIKFQEK